MITEHHPSMAVVGQDESLPAEKIQIPVGMYLIRISVVSIEKV
jgi:hypothetical protein